ncbi:probable phytol kinase 1, chloroplastic [Rutidosis leptorrhynchoides]|uniref:probable phytol kinase 1, chloroplastic n=1 Tax=Rutidosis leptorrhynchoides TaxID=125765 RepID=UPI003A9A28F6
MILLSSSSSSNILLSHTNLAATNHRRPLISHYLQSPPPRINRRVHLHAPWETSLLFPRPRTSVTYAATAGAWFQDAGATAAVMAGGYGFVKAFDTLTEKDIIPQKLSRKPVHIFSGLLFVISWPIFSTCTEARYFASLVPLVNCLRLLINGLSLTSDQGLVKSVTRQGNPQELLRGPLYYVVVLILCVLFFWRESPIGLVSVSMMCGGDGIADIMGRRFGSMKIPYNKEKSFAGSISMFVFGFLISIGMLYYYSVMGYFELDWTLTIQKIALVSLVPTMVESLPINKLVDDNISVPLSTAISTYILL